MKTIMYCFAMIFILSYNLYSVQLYNIAISVSNSINYESKYKKTGFAKPKKNISLSLLKGEILVEPGEMVSLTYRLEKSKKVITGDSLCTRGTISRVNFNKEIDLELGSLTRITIIQIASETIVIRLDQGIVRIISKSNQPKFSYIFQSSNIKVISKNAQFALATNQRVPSYKSPKEKIVCIEVHEGSVEVRLVEYPIDTSRAFKSITISMGESKKIYQADHGKYLTASGCGNQLDWDTKQDKIKEEYHLIKKVEKENTINKRQLTKEVKKEKRQDHIEVIIEDLPRNESFVKSDLPEDIEITQVDSENMTKSDVMFRRDTPAYKSWAFPFRKKFSALPYLSTNKIFYVPLKGKELIGINQFGQLMFDLNVDADVVTQPTGNKDLIFFGTRFGTIYAINKLGKVQWKKENIGKFPANSTFYLFNNLVIVAFNNKIMALTMSNGSTVWNFFVNSSISYSPTGDSDNIYFMTDKFAFALTGYNGKKKWKSNSIDQFTARPVVAKMNNNNILLVCTNSQVTGLHSNNGTVAWVIDNMKVKSNPISKDDYFYISTDFGTINKIDAKNGTTQWEYAINAVNPYISIDEKYLYISYNSYTFITLDFKTGEEVNRFKGLYGDNIVTPIYSLNYDTDFFFGTEGMRIFKDSSK